LPLDEILGLFEMESPLGIEMLHGGVNHVWRVRTEGAELAVHQLLGLSSDDRAVRRCQRIFELEVAAAGRGVPLARPIASSAGPAAVAIPGWAGVFTVHEWIDGAAMGDRVASPDFYRGLGTSLGTIHSLALDPGNEVDVRLEADEWVALVHAGLAAGAPWANTLGDAVEEFLDAHDRLDGWEALADEAPVFSHADLTSANVLERDGAAVLIDWESATAVQPAVELGRTALDQLHVLGPATGTRLEALLRGYAEVRALPAVGPHWCALWIRGLVLFAAQCAQSCVEGTGSAALLRHQAQIIERTPDELRRRLAIVDELTEIFDRAVAAVAT
jgi:Ser/Thr protein kinase RdoA (MazF antagonist)